jgi:hypothetical protein
MDAVQAAISDPNWKPKEAPDFPPGTKTGVLANAAAGAVEGGAGLANMVADPFGTLIGKPLATGAVFAHDLIAPMFGGQRFTDAQRDSLLGDDDTPEPGTRLANAVGSAMGAPSLDQVQPANDGQRGVRAAAAGAVGMAGMVPGRVAPLIGAASGIAGQQAADAAPSWAAPMASFAGQTIGGIGAASAAAGTHALATGAGRLAAGAARPFVGRAAPVLDSAGQPMVDANGNPLAATAGQQQLAGQRIHQAADDPNAVVDTLNNPAPPLVPGSQPTTFQATGDQGIGGLQRAMETNNGPAFIAHAGEQNAARVGAIQALSPEADPADVGAAFRAQLDAINAQGDAATTGNRATKQGAVAATGNPIAPQDAGAAVKGGVAANWAPRLAAADRAVAAGEAIAAGAVDALGGNPAQTDVQTEGTRQRGTLEAIKAPVKVEASELFNTIDPNGTLALDQTNIGEAAQQLLDDPMLRAGGQLAAAEAPVLRYAAGIKGVQSFSDLRALMSNIKAAQRTIRADPGLGVKSQPFRRMTILRSATEDAVQQAVVDQAQRDVMASASGNPPADGGIVARLAKIIQPEAEPANAAVPPGPVGGGASEPVAPRGIPSGQAAAEIPGGDQRPGEAPGIPGRAGQPEPDQGASGLVAGERQVAPATAASGSATRVEQSADAGAGTRLAPGAVHPDDLDRVRAAIADIGTPGLPQTRYDAAHGVVQMFHNIYGDDGMRGAAAAGPKVPDRVAKSAEPGASAPEPPKVEPAPVQPEPPEVEPAPPTGTGAGAGAGAGTPETGTAPSLRDRVVDAYLAQTGGNVKQPARIADIHAALPDVPLPDLHAELVRMELDPKVRGGTMPFDDPNEITPADKAAALSVGGEQRHLLWLGQRPAPFHERLAANVAELDARNAPSSSPPNTNVPTKVLDRLRGALSELKDAAAQVRRVRETIDGPMAGGGGRYEADVLTNRATAIAAAHAEIEKFRASAARNGIDADAVLAKLGGVPDLTPSEGAKGWLEPKKPVKAESGETRQNPAPVPGEAGTAAESRQTPEPTTPSLAGGLEAIDPATIKTDAQRFQYKEGGDEAGITDRLRGVQKWDPRLAGVAMVWRDKDGQNWIADGHQRLGLANRMAARGQGGIRLNAFVLNEADGVTAADARAIAAAKNIAEGSGTPLDAAKVIRQARVVGTDMPPLPPRSALVRDGSALANLGDDAFGMVVNEVVPFNQAAVVGRMVSDHAQQAEAMRVLAQLKPDNIRQAETVVQDLLNSGTETAHQDSLFGPEAYASSVVLERAQIPVSCSSRHQKTVRLRKNAVYHLLRWLSEGERGWPRCM